MSLIRLALLFLLLLVAVLFIVSNQTEVQLSFALVPYKSPHLPLWLVVLAVMFFAYLIGALTQWLSSYSLRRRLKRAEIELASTQAQLRATTQQLTALQIMSSRPPAPPLPPAD